MGMLIFFLRIQSSCNLNFNSYYPQLSPCGSTSPSVIDGCTPDACNFNIDDELTGPGSTAWRMEAKRCLFKNLFSHPTKIHDKDNYDRNFIHYFYKFNHYLRIKFNSCIQRDIFEFIFFKFNGNLDRIAVFLAHCVHNTSGFKDLVGEKDQFYYSRGILQIQGEENYKSIGYENCPGRLEYLNLETVSASIDFYNKKVKYEYQFTLCDSWYYLWPVEIQGRNYELDIYQKRIVGRINVYLDICNVFVTRRNFGNNCYFISRYR